MRELGDDVRIVEIAAERDLRHRQVIAHQEFDGLPRLGGNLETIEGGPRHPDAFLRVIRVGGLADVVEQQRQGQDLRACAAPRAARRSVSGPEWADSTASRGRGS